MSSNQQSEGLTLADLRAPPRRGSLNEAAKVKVIRLTGQSQFHQQSAAQKEEVTTEPAEDDGYADLDDTEGRQDRVEKKPANGLEAVQAARKAKAAKARVDKRKQEDRVTVNISQCMYEVVTMCAEDRGWSCVDEEEDMNESARHNLYWIDKSQIQEHFKRIRGWQKINHIPGTQT